MNSQQSGDFCSSYDYSHFVHHADHREILSIFVVILVKKYPWRSAYTVLRKYNAKFVMHRLKCAVRETSLKDYPPK